MNSPNTLWLLGALLGMTAGSCALPSVKAMPPDSAPLEIKPEPSAMSPPRATQMEATRPKLYARDGSVISEQPSGTLTVAPDTGQTAGTEQGSRWTLLEQYQSVIQRNEELEAELRGLTLALDRADEREEQMSFSMEENQAKIAELMERIETLESHNVELASRLTTAQIRRLQSEKLLLEAKLDWKRVEATIAMRPTESSEGGTTNAAAPTNGDTNP